MKKQLLFFLVALMLAGGAFAQSTATLEKVHGAKSLGNSRYGTVIWDNWAESGWFSSMTARYIWLDWGKLVDQGNLMPDEVVDGFTFAYSTDYASGRISWNMYFYDSCTGWGDLSAIQEAGFAFTGLPDASYLTPGYFWTWEINVDLDESGYEFLLGYEIGVGHSLITEGITCGPCLGKPPLVGGNGDTFTQNAFDIFGSTGEFLGTFSFGSYPANPYATYRAQLRGASDPSHGCAYSPDPYLQGNNTGLYCVGTWANGRDNKFLLRMNGMTPQGGVFLNCTSKPTWYAGIGKTTYPALAGCFKIPFSYSYTGDYVVYPFTCGPDAVALTWYIQGAITDWLVGGAVTPIDLSMDAVVS